MLSTRFLGPGVVCLSLAIAWSHEEDKSTLEVGATRDDKPRLGQPDARAFFGLRQGHRTLHRGPEKCKQCPGRIRSQAPGRA